ncbi:MAG TPA: hypothetical protein VG755_15165 [Nannocystaceae bacterium]|nr:hypothetical protein [Nannocystaceae bacterium]
MFEEAEAHLSGATFIAKVRAFEARVGADVVKRAIAKLPDDRVAEYEAVVPVAWVRASTADLLFEAIADEAGASLFTIYPAIVEEAVGNVLRTLWRSMAPAANDDALVQRIPQFYAKGHDRGQLRVHVREPGRAELELTGWPDASELRLLGIAGTSVAILVHAGREDVAVSRRRTDDGAMFELRWRQPV